RHRRCRRQFQVQELEADLEIAIAEDAVQRLGARVDRHGIAVDEQVEADLAGLPDLQRVGQADADAIGAQVAGAAADRRRPFHGDARAHAQHLAFVFSLFSKHVRPLLTDEPGSIIGAQSSSRSLVKAWSMRSTATMVMPSIFCLGTLPFAITAIEKPSLAASRRRSWPRGAGRISPARPTSPNTTRPRGSGLLRIDELIANSTARSAAGSVILTPPTALMNTSWS